MINFITSPDRILCTCVVVSVEPPWLQAKSSSALHLERCPGCYNLREQVQTNQNFRNRPRIFTQHGFLEKNMVVRRFWHFAYISYPSPSLHSYLCPSSYFCLSFHLISSAHILLPSTSRCIATTLALSWMYSLMPMSLRCIAILQT